MKLNMQIKTVKKSIITGYLSNEFLPFKFLFLNLQKNNKKKVSIPEFACIYMYMYAYAEYA